MLKEMERIQQHIKHFTAVILTIPKLFNFQTILKLTLEYPGKRDTHTQSESRAPKSEVSAHL